MQIHRMAVAAGACAALASPALAHHGFGRFDMTAEVRYSGTLTGMDLVNPHSYMNLDVVQPDGSTLAMRCEMRAASLLKRSGWSAEMFVVGAHVEMFGRPHKDDPHSCYVETFTIGDGPEVNRNDQLAIDNPVDVSNRPLRLASGELNISGDWAVEQGVLTVPPEGGSGAIVPKSLRAAYASGELTLEEIRARAPQRPTPVYTSEGQAAADAFRNANVEDNPRLRCEPTSILFDWTFDWPVNRIAQEEGRIVIDYGLITTQRVIHMGLDAHPADVAPSNSGHSIGRWEGDTLVVDTVGFAPGVLSPPLRNSDKLHVVERFTLDTESLALRRDYTAEDPVYLAEPYVGWDVVYPSETPFAVEPCKELTYEFSEGVAGQ